MIALNTTNDMLRNIGLNVPVRDDRIFDPDFAHLEYHEDYEVPIMDTAGWDNHTAVDEFQELSTYDLLLYAQGMGFDFDA